MDAVRESIEVNRRFGDRLMRLGYALYPDVGVVRFLSRLKRDGAVGGRGLDLGCGGGRHLLTLQEFGYSPMGLDVSEDAIAAARGFCQAAGIDSELMLSAFEAAEFESPLDVILACGVMYLQPIQELKLQLKRCSDWLRPGGAMWANFRHPDTSFSKSGVLRPDGLVEIDERSPQHAGGRFLFLERDQILELVGEAGFEVFNSERTELWRNANTERHVWEAVWLRRPG
ncbi:class I SAM-dependent methyltransferase [Caulobacter sp. NIBR2454]|uniref:class I SAM-dependent methyltransferase n=1 Tax=Caulobacter sp. NIBR2454 TaxID=3015996 RepID=UPI0022B6BEA2|nr:class I SAM-dependent methyltransferase [Caulobacter sp. NIBR2454]